MMNIIRSVLFPPICGPQLTPDTENGAGALQRLFAERQVATPLPCSPPTTKAPFTSFGITATHFAPSSTSFGTPLSGDALVMCCTVSVARDNSELSAVLFSSCACARMNEPRQNPKKAMATFAFVNVGITPYLLEVRFRSTVEELQ